VEAWAQDEMRLGLKPVLRRVWAPRGERPVARFERRYEWVYLYGFVRPTSGEVFWLVLPTVNARAFSLALRHFAEWVGAGEGKKRVLLVLDRAGWHTGGEVEVPEGVELEFLPARSPELMPAERLWPSVNERGMANRPFEDLDGLEDALVERCLALSEQPGLIRGCTGYHWWPDTA
jgi:transposase